MQHDPAWSGLPESPEGRATTSQAEGPGRPGTSQDARPNRPSTSRLAYPDPPRRRAQRPRGTGRKSQFGLGDEGRLGSVKDSELFDFGVIGGEGEAVASADVAVSEVWSGRMRARLGAALEDVEAWAVVRSAGVTLVGMHLIVEYSGRYSFAYFLVI